MSGRGDSELHACCMRSDAARKLSYCTANNASYLSLMYEELTELPKIFYGFSIPYTVVRT